MASQFDLLKTRRFLPLFLTQFIGAFNDNVFKNALVILITYQAGTKAGVDPRLLVTAAAGIFILPFFLFSATAGQLADKYEKAWLIRLIRLIEIPVMLLAGIGFALENYWMLLGVLFGAGTQAAFFGPLKYSILPEHLKNDELIGGNALVEAGTFIAILLGTILGGILILLPGGILIVSGILFAAALAGWICSLGIPKAAPGAPGLHININFIAEAWRLVRAASKEKEVFPAILGISWFWLVGFTFLAQFPVYARDALGANEQVVTLFLTLFSVGIALGSLVCNRLLKGRISAAYVPMGALGMTAGIFLLWLATPAATAHEGLIGLMPFIGSIGNWFIIAALLLIAVFGGIYIVPLYTIMQTRCAESHRSRTVAANNILNALFMVGGAVLTMVLLKMHMNVTEIFLAVGIVNLGAAALLRRFSAGAGVR
jgi:acyl-[acyl-carrier-protein]-phospholipid O-acyltransferase/long-chain-fatty-acid--[acyl-carrier-protein] ligase